MALSPRTRKSLWALAGLALALALFRAFLPAPVRVEVARVTRGALRVTLDEDARTRVRERYTMSAPVQGRLLRTSLHPGDAVEAGRTPVAEFVPAAPNLLDERSRAETRARILRAQAAVKEAEAARDQAEADQRYAEAELARIVELGRQEIESTAALERAQREATRTREALRAASFRVQVTEYELELARASSREPGAVDPRTQKHAQGEAADDGDGLTLGRGGRLRLRSPVDGTVLRVFEESARTLPPGTPILEIGNTEALEIVAEYLSQDAVKIRPGMEALVHGWGGEAIAGEEPVLRGRVRVVEPAGFTKVSALGVEEQRVNVLVDPEGDREPWAALGDGYRVDLRVVIWESDSTLTVPTGALFRDEGEWAVFAIVDGRAQRTRIELGRRSGLDAEVRSGLEEGERVILFPSDLIEEGTAVEEPR